jgi:hypothetical protein
MKIVKIIVVVLVLLAAVVAGVVFYGLNNLNGFVEEIIENTGSKLTQTAVGVGSVDIKLLEGSGAIYSLSIANPKGYSANSLFSAKSVALKLDIESLTKPVKVINKVSVGEISLRAEQKNLKDTNIQTLLDNLQSASAAKPSASNGGSQDVRIMIERLTFAETIIDLQTEKFGGKTLTLPSFSLTNIGDKKTGLTPEQAGQTIIKQLLSKVKDAVKAELTKMVKDEAKEQLKEKLQETLQDQLSTDKLKSLFK